MKTLSVLILLLFSVCSYAQNILPPGSNLFQDNSGDKAKNANQAIGILQISMEIKQPITATVTDDMRYLTGIVVDVETREIEEANVISKEAKITVKAEPSGNYLVRLDDEAVTADNSIAMSITDKHSKRTLPESGSDTFQVSGVFVNDVATDDEELAPKSITVIYDSV